MYNESCADILVYKQILRISSVLCYILDLRIFEKIRSEVVELQVLSDFI